MHISIIRHGVSHNNIFDLLEKLKVKQTAEQQPEHEHWIRFLEHFTAHLEPAYPLQDPPLLSPLGIRHCRNRSRYYRRKFKHHNIIFTSQLRRTIETAIYLFKGTNKFICPLPGYNEIGINTYGENDPLFMKDHYFDMCRTYQLRFIDYYYSAEWLIPYNKPTTADDVLKLLQPISQLGYIDITMDSYSHSIVMVGHGRIMRDLKDVTERPHNLEQWDIDINHSTTTNESG